MRRGQAWSLFGSCLGRSSFRLQCLVRERSMVVGFLWALFPWGDWRNGLRAVSIAGWRVVATWSNASLSLKSFLFLLPLQRNDPHASTTCTFTPSNDHSLLALQFAIGLEGPSTRVRSIRPVRLVLRLFLYTPSNRPCNKLLGLKLLGQIL